MRSLRALLALTLLLGSAPIGAQAIGGALAPLRGRISPNLFAVRVTRPANRVNLVFIGDGYRGDEMGLWAAHVDAMVARLLSGESPPYDRYKNFINVYRVDLVSAQSGVDDPANNVFVNTALDGCNCCIDFTIGQCQVDFFKTHAAIDAATPNLDVHWRLVALNTPLFIGGTHYPAQGSLAVYATRNADTFRILTHEAGHGFHFLQDEYYDSRHGSNRYTGGEPTAANLTSDAMAIKWREWLGFAQPGLGPVGSYEGGFVRYDQGIWRPSPQSRMNGFSNPLDAIGKERAIHSIYEIVDPLDDHGPRTADVSPTARLWVRAVDPAVIRVEWFVDGLSVATGEYLDLGSLTLARGPHQIEARARDAVLDHAFSDNLAPHPLDLVRRNMEPLTEVVRWRTVVP